uniref:Carboxylesterase type B domain-containing protein n=1 Tax=Clastoptera arizonana TaxID=38151 RepID=A0A1B6CIS4_9HEMI
MADQFVEVATESGILRGKKKLSTGLTSVPYYAFLGVPYAKPPIGDLRFKAPQPLEPWKGVRDALKDGSSAPQGLFTPGQVRVMKTVCINCAVKTVFISGTTALRALEGCKRCP